MSSYGSGYSAYSDPQHMSTEERGRVEIIAGQAYNMLCRQDSKVSPLDTGVIQRENGNGHKGFLIRVDVELFAHVDSVPCGAIQKLTPHYSRWLLAILSPS